MSDNYHTTAPLSEIYAEEDHNIGQRTVKVYCDYIEALVDKKDVTAEERSFVADCLQTFQAITRDNRQKGKMLLSYFDDFSKKANETIEDLKSQLRYLAVDDASDHRSIFDGGKEHKVSDDAKNDNTAIGKGEGTSAGKNGNDDTGNNHPDNGSPGDRDTDDGNSGDDHGRGNDDGEQSTKFERGSSTMVGHRETTINLNSLVIRPVVFDGEKPKPRNSFLDFIPSSRFSKPKRIVLYQTKTNFIFTTTTSNFANKMSNEKAIHQVENADGREIAAKEIRDVRSEALTLRTQAIQIADTTRDQKQESEIKPLPKSQGTAYHCDLFIAHITTILVPEPYPQISTFLKSSHHMFYIVHIMDDLLSSNRQFCQSNKQWNPLISRYYYSVLDVIQTLRAMEEADILDTQDKLFLHQFLSRFPPQSLSIAGPLISYYQSICVSECQYPTFGAVCPIMPHPNQYHPRGANGTPHFSYVNYMIPNIPGIVSMINQLATPERQSQLINGTLLIPFNPAQTITVNNQQRASTLNGTNVPTIFEDVPPQMRYYFTSPGMEYPNEADSESLKAFSQQIYKYGFPELQQNSRFGTTQSYLCLPRPEIFSIVNAVMARANKHFGYPGNLDHCPPRGCQAGQIILTRTLPQHQPRNYRDVEAIINGSFEAHTVNHTITQVQAQLAFASKIHSVFPSMGDPEHPLNGIGTDRLVGNVRSGPFWNSSTLTLTAGLDEGYLRYPEIIRNKYYLEKPEN